MPEETLLTREQDQARRQVDRFIRRFEPAYRQLAYYAALPLVLTPELLHYLRNQFLRQVQLPWVAEADLLLSDLCYPIAYEQYAMDTAVRACLMAEMEQELGPDRLRAVAKLLLRYVQHLEMMNPYLSYQDLQAQQWAAMIYVDDRQRQKVAHQLVKAYDTVAAPGQAQRLSGPAQAEMARLSRLTEELAPKLRAYPQLLDYARVIGRLLTEPTRVSAQAVRRSYEVLEGVTRDIPEDIIPDAVRQSGSELDGFAALRTIDFIHGRLIDAASERDSNFPPFQSDQFQIATVTLEISSPQAEFQLFEFQVATLVRQQSKWVIQQQTPSAYRFTEQLAADASHSSQGLLQALSSLEMVSIPGDT